MTIDEMNLSSTYLNTLNVEDISPEILEGMGETASGIWATLGDFVPSLSYINVALEGAGYLSYRGYAKEGSVYPGQAQFDNALISGVGAGIRGAIVAALAGTVGIGYVMAGAGLTAWNLKVGADKKRMQKNAEFKNWDNKFKISEDPALGISTATRQKINKVLSYTPGNFLKTIVEKGSLGIIDYGENIDAREYISPIDTTVDTVPIQEQKTAIKSFLQATKLAQTNTDLNEKLQERVPGFVPNIIGNGRDLIEQCFRNVTKNHEKNNGKFYTRKEILEAMVEFGKNIHIYENVNEIISLFGPPITSSASTLKLLETKRMALTEHLLKNPDIKESAWQIIKATYLTLIVPSSVSTPRPDAEIISEITEKVAEKRKEINTLLPPDFPDPEPPDFTEQKPRILGISNWTARKTASDTAKATWIANKTTFIRDFQTNKNSALTSIYAISKTSLSSYETDINLLTSTESSISVIMDDLKDEVSDIPRTSTSSSSTPTEEEFKTEFTKNPLLFFSSRATLGVRADQVIENIINTTPAGARDVITEYLTQTPFVDNTSFATSSATIGRYKDLNEQIEEKFYERTTDASGKTTALEKIIPRDSLEKEILKEVAAEGIIKIIPAGGRFLLKFFK